MRTTYPRGSIAFLLLACSATSLSAQDSSRADWRDWLATKDSVERCRILPVVERIYTYPNEYSIHRTQSGGTCKAGPGPADPVSPGSSMERCFAQTPVPPLGRTGRRSQRS